MPLNKLDSIIKNTEGRILYVSPSDLDSTDSISNQGNSLARPFKTLQRALIESARFSYVKGNSNDETEKTTILLMPGEHVIDNRPGYTIDSAGGITTPDGSTVRPFALTLDSVFDLTQKDNDLYKFNSVNGGVIVPRGTSIVGLDLRKTKLRPLYVPNPTDDSVDYSALFRITGACYLWQFSIFDANEFETVYTQPNDFSVKSTPTFSHHKLTVFEYADGVNEVGSKGLTDLQMYYAKLSQAYSTGSGRPVDTDDTFPINDLGFNPRRPEFEIVGAFAADPITISSIQAGDGLTATRRIKVTTQEEHELNVGTPIRIKGVSDNSYNISTKVVSIDTDNNKIFFYNITEDPTFVNPGPFTSQGTVTIETDTVTGASPYIFNISMRSVWGMQGMNADGNKATGFRSMVVAQFTGVSLQKDDRAFVKYNESSRTYENTFYAAGTTQSGSELSSKSSSTGTVYHLDSGAIYRQGWEQSHIKISNDAIVQVVSVFAIGYNKHFVAETGGDASITNSNSNFGQLSLVSDGFKKEAFAKDNKAFITHIIPPRTIDSTEESIDWLTLDQDASNTSTKLYIFGFKNKQVNPQVLTQGYRVGAKVNDKLFLGTNSASILMPNGASSFEQYSVDAPSNNLFTVSNSGTHNLTTGEKVIIISDDGDLPENLRTNTVYYAIAPNNTTFKLAASLAEATSDSPIQVYSGTNLKVTTRVSDKEAGDIGHPVQFDESAGQWYITVSATGNTITSQLTGSGATDEPTTVKRISDNRSLDEKIYKVRVVVPSQLTNAKTPESGFVIQESSSTGIRTDADASASSISTSDYDFNRNLRLISTCSFSTPTVTVVAELPHNLKTGDSIIVKNVTDSTNTTGLIDKGYNGTFTITVVDDLTFTYTTSTTPGASFTNNVNSRTTALPRFERNNLQENIYIYRNEIISEYEENDSNGVYHIYALNANNAIQNQFTNLKYSQNVTDLYPQLDRDNVNDNPNSATTYALRSPIGEVQTDDLKKSITRETTDRLLTTLGIGLDVSSVTNPTSTSPTVVFDRNHGFAGIVTGSVPATSGFSTGTYYNVKIYDNSGLTTWNGATAKVVVSTGTNISSVEIINGGSNYSAGTYFLDTSVIGVGNNNAFTVVTSGLTSGIGQAIQFTGIGTGTDTYHRITGVTARNSVSIARTTGDPVITSDNYGFVTGPSVAFTASGDNITAIGHGLEVGNKFRVIDGSNNNVGDYIVGVSTSPNEFEVTGGIGAASGFILKHGLSSNKGVSDRTDENLQARAITIFDGETLTLTESSGITVSTTSFSVSGAQGGVIERFPLGTYIQVDEEIMRISSSSLSGVPSDKITVIRGALATKATTHVVNSVIKKIKVPTVEFRRPSILRASSHTFEYLGYGPGNYSTALPQVQDRTLTEREEFLSQSQERSNGLVVYTGMNNKGDFFIGNQKKSSATGEETNFDIPVPTVTGEDPARLSAVFDEVIIKERLVVEGGKSNQVLSQFDGPVTFNEKIKATNTVKISNPLDSTGTTSGALVVTGGIGVGKTITAQNVTVGNVTIKGSTSEVSTTSGDLNVTALEGNSVAIKTDTTITGEVLITGVTTITGDTDIIGDLDLTNSPSNKGRISANYLDVPNISPVGSIMIWPGATNSWPTTNWRECNGAGGFSQANHPDLWAVIGNTYGGNSSNFNLPDLQGQFITGIGADTWNNTLAGTGGRSDVVLPQHNHDIDDPGHAHDFVAARENGNVEQNDGAIQCRNTNLTTDANTTGITIDDVVSTNTNASIVNNSDDINIANLPPYRALYYIIRIK